MKKIIQITAIAFILVLSIYHTNAQTTKLKVGHINSTELLQMMPGKDSAQQALTQYAAELEQQLQIMTQEFESKYQEYQANQTKWTEIVRKSKEQELVDLQNRIVEFQEVAQEDLQNKEAELISPLLKKAQDAINEVAKEKGYTYILDTSTGTVLYFEDADDILPFVKKKLGIE
jgi:outer membrane protein